jgi:hypothetical protein
MLQLQQAARYFQGAYGHGGITFQKNLHCAKRGVGGSSDGGLFMETASASSARQGFY